MIRNLLMVFFLLALAGTLLLWIDSYRVRTHGPVAGPPFSSFSVDPRTNRVIEDAVPRGIWFQRQFGTRGFAICSGNGHLGLSVYTLGGFTPGPADVRYKHLHWLRISWMSMNDGRGSFARQLSLPFPTLVVAFALYPAATLICRFLVRAIRRWRGACLRCGYDLTANVTGICPECALPVPGPRSKSTDVSGVSSRSS